MSAHQDTDRNAPGADRPRIGRQVRAEVMVFQPMLVIEISSTAILAETSFPLQVNSLHELRLALGDRSVVVRGRVAQCSISEVGQELLTYRSSFEFIEPSDYGTGVILDFLNGMQEGQD